jgi:hypothetical protein
MNNIYNLYIALGLLVCTIVCGVFIKIKLNSDYTDSTTESDCSSWTSDLSKIKDGDSCSVWTDNKCRRGTYTAGSSPDLAKCDSPRDFLPLILLIISIICLIASIVFGVRYARST